MTQRIVTIAWIALVFSAHRASAADIAPPAVEFNRDIRPILSDTCFQCHGPDRKQRKADLRLDTEEGAFADRDGRHALVPGKLDESELYQRITAADEAERMPPLKSGKKLSSQQIDLFRRWIEQGAKWQKHWSLIAPQRPALPAVKNTAWVRNGIDAFILARLEREGLAPSPEADKSTLLRRVTLDLTGLPPTPAEVDAFLADNSPGAYEKIVDRLLQSPRYGERMAVRWLDAARYADTSGYQSDGVRHMWRWRDWVIDAFNRNMPFDQFTVEQLAGDLLPNPTLDQRIATGFNRNHRGNAEGGIIPEEYAVEYVVDRVDTTATVWLGLTMGCGRCHDHKFDPITQKEFYQVFAYFNNVPEKGRALKVGNSPPYIPSPTAADLARLRRVDAELAAAESRFAALQPQLAAAQTEWERTLAGTPPIQWSPSEGLVAHFALDGESKERANPQKKIKARKEGASVPRNRAEQGIAANGREWTHIIRVYSRPFAALLTLVEQSQAFEIKDGESAFVPGRLGQAADFDGQRFIDAGDVANFGYFDKFSLAAWVNPKGSAGGTILSRMTDVSQGDGWSVALENGKLQVNLTKRWLDDALRVATEATLTPERWQHVLVTYDGSRLASGVRIYLDGRPQKLTLLLDELNQTFTTREPLRIGGGDGPEGRFHGAIDEVRIYNEVLSPVDAEILAATDSITEIAGIPADKRTPSQAQKLRAYFLENAAAEAVRQAGRALVALRRQRDELIGSFPTTMVMEELPVPRDTFVLLRGEYDKPGEKVSPGVPASLSPLPAGAAHNRLEFAKWLLDPANPLTARVAVNRAWQMYFGTGLVKTVDDFGSQGEWPSHPELLDWLAVEFGQGTDIKSEIRNPKSETNPKSEIRNSESWRWNVKALQKLIVMSATYRQSSKVTPALLQRDPENRLLARGPRVRLSAEMVRDQALAASGLLVEKVGGPSVRPYQPAGLWKELTGAEDYTQDHGESLYRRSMYTFWKRTVAPPTMLTFDAAGREACVVRETRTNTPLQALTLLNEVTFVEAARLLAQRVMTEARTPAERVTLAFRLVAARRPTAVELDILLAGLDQHLDRYRKAPQAAIDLVTTGESPRNEKLDVSELAAYTAMTGLILNLDETITKE